MQIGSCLFDAHFVTFCAVHLLVCKDINLKMKVTIATHSLFYDIIAPSREGRVMHNYCPALHHYACSPLQDGLENVTFPSVTNANGARWAISSNKKFWSHPSRVGKRWEPRNPVPGPFLAKIRKVNKNWESRQEFRMLSKFFGKLYVKLARLGVRPKKKSLIILGWKIRKVGQNSEISSGELGKITKVTRKIRKVVCKISQVHPEN